MTDLTICIITYNSVNYLPKLMNSILNSTLKNYKTLFIDNKSADDTIKYIKNKYLKKQDVKLIKLDKNIGHSAAANIALKKCETRYIIFIDHDTILDKEMLNILYNKAKNNSETNFAVFAPMIIDRSRNEIQYGGFMHFICKMEINKKEIKNDSEIGIVGTTAPLIDLHKIPKGLLFDNNFFIYLNDLDYFYRIKMMGLKIMLVPSAKITHLEGTPNFSFRGTGCYPALRAFYLIRNQKLFLLKNYSFKNLLLVLPILFLYEIFQIIFSIKNNFFVEGYLKANLSFIFLILETTKKRQVIQKNRKIGDKFLVGCYKLSYNHGVISNKFEQIVNSLFNNFLCLYYRLIKSFLN